MTINGIAQKQMDIKAMEQLASGKRINSAKDDAAGMAISEKLMALVQGTDKGTENAEAMQDAYAIADGALSGISDSINRMRELGLQASNGTLGDSERSMIQQEIDQIKQGISDSIENANYNGIKLLNGEFKGHTASNADGSGMTGSIGEMGLKTLGLAEFDVTKGVVDFDALDNASSTLSQERAKIGAYSNRLDNSISFNNVASINLAAARSRVADADMAAASTNYNKEKTAEQYRLNMQQRAMQNQGSFLQLLS